MFIKKSVLRVILAVQFALVLVFLGNFKQTASAISCNFGDMPVQTTSLNVAVAGEYRVWTRYKSTVSDTLNVEVDGNCYQVMIQASSGQWTWINKKTDNQAFQHTIASAGSHTVKFGVQTGDVQIDKFAFLALGSICSDSTSEPKTLGDNCATPPSTTTSTPTTPTNQPATGSQPPISGSTKLPETTLPLVNSNNSQASKINYYINDTLVASVEPGQTDSKLDTTKLANGKYTLKTEVIYDDGTVASEQKEIQVENPLMTVAFAKYAKWFKAVAITVTFCVSWIGITALLRKLHNRKIYMVTHGIDKKYMSTIPSDPALFKQKMYAVAVVSTIALNSLIFIPINKLFASLNNNYYTVEAESATTSDGNLVKTVKDSSASGGSYLGINKKTQVVQQCPTGQSGTYPNCSSPPTGKFYIVGKDIIDPDGNKFFPFGGNVAINAGTDGTRSWVFDFGGTANGHSSQAVSWGWTAVRATLICDTMYYGGTPAGGVQKTQTEKVDALEQFVNEYTAKKIVVMIDCQDTTSNTGDHPDVTVGSNLMNTIQSFWDIAAPRFKNNPYVWYNTMNEPIGGTNDTAWLSVQKNMLSRVRATGAENIFVADLPDWAQSASSLSDGTIGSQLKATNSCNVLFSWHAYGGSTNTDPSKFEGWIQGIQAKNLALIYGEYGYRIDGQPPYGAIAFQTSVDATDKVLALGKTYGVGSLVWHGTGDSNYNSLYSLSSDNSQAKAAFFNHADGTGLSSLGQKVWNAGHSKPSLGKYTGTYAPSNCSSAVDR